MTEATNVPVFKKRGRRPGKLGVSEEIKTILDAACKDGHLIPGPMDAAKRMNWRKNLQNGAKKLGFAITTRITEGDGLWITKRESTDDKDGGAAA